LSHSEGEDSPPEGKPTTHVLVLNCFGLSPAAPRAERERERLVLVDARHTQLSFLVVSSSTHAHAHAMWYPLAVGAEVHRGGAKGESEISERGGRRGRGSWPHSVRIDAFFWTLRGAWRQRASTRARGFVWQGRRFFAPYVVPAVDLRGSHAATAVPVLRCLSAEPQRRTRGVQPLCGAASGSLLCRRVVPAVPVRCRI